MFKSRPSTGGDVRMYWPRDGRFSSKVGQIGPQIGQIRDFFKSDFSTFGSIETNVLKSDLKKYRICPISGPIWPTLETKLLSLSLPDTPLYRYSCLGISPSPWVGMKAQYLNIFISINSISAKKKDKKSILRYLSIEFVLDAFYF